MMHWKLLRQTPPSISSMNLVSYSIVLLKIIPTFLILLQMTIIDQCVYHAHSAILPPNCDATVDVQYFFDCCEAESIPYNDP